MSSTQMSSRRIVSNIALFTVIAAFLLIFTSAGASAAAYSALDSVKEFFGSRSTVSGTSAPMLPEPLRFMRINGVNTIGAVAIDEAWQASAPLADITSNAVTGDWSSTSTWVGGVVPVSGDNVTIADGATITIDSVAGNPTVGNLIVGGGTSGILNYNATAAQTLSIGGNLTLNAGATLQTAATGNVVTHILDVSGNITNTGNIDLSTNTNTAGATLRFSGAANSTYSGTGATNDLFILLPNKSTISQIIDLNLSNFSVRGLSSSATGALLTTAVGTGTLKLSGTNTFSGILWSVNSYSVPSTMGIWLNNPNFTVTGQNASPTLSGLFRISSGTYNVGTIAGNSMGFLAGSSIIVEGGAVNTAGRFGVAALGNAIAYTQTNGTITVQRNGNSSTTLAGFDMGNSLSSTINISGGTIIVQLANTAAGLAGPRDYRNQAGNGFADVIGGTLRLGNASSGLAKVYGLSGALPNVVVTTTSGNHSVVMNTNISNYNHVSRNVTPRSKQFNGFRKYNFLIWRNDADQ